MGTSSANPFKLGSYSTDGLELVATLKTKSTAVVTALDTLRTSSSPHLPALGDADATLADLVGDWHHLDEFAGDVANAFFQANQHLMDRPLGADRTDSMVLSLDDGSVLRLGNLGYADRDVAIADANRLADDLQAALDDRDISADEMAALADRAARGQHDPAFSITFVEAMGVDGMTRVPFLVEAAWPGGEHADNPGWGQEQLVPFATLLGTAMDTRAATRQIDRHDPDNEDLADEDRLSEAWVDEFTSFWQPEDFDQPNNFHYSLLVNDADLPTDVLVAVADRQLDYLLAHDATPRSYMNGVPWGYQGSTAEINILGALGDNGDASLQWLDQKSPGDGAFGYPGRTATNMEMLLRYAPYTTGPLLGDALATVVDNGLQHWDDTAGDLDADTGNGFGGESRTIGALTGLITEADENGAVAATEQRIASRQNFVNGTYLLKDIVGLTPAGPLVRGATLAFYHEQNFGIAGASHEVDQDYANIENVRTGIRAELTSTAAAYEYGVKGTWTSAEVTAATTQALGDRAAGADTDFFLDGTTGDRRPIKPYYEMSTGEKTAYNAWINSDQVGDAIVVERTASGQRMDEVIDSLEHR